MKKRFREDSLTDYITKHILLHIYSYIVISKLFFYFLLSYHSNRFKSTNLITIKIVFGFIPFEFI